MTEKTVYELRDDVRRLTEFWQRAIDCATQEQKRAAQFELSFVALGALLMSIDRRLAKLEGKRTP